MIDNVKQFYAESVYKLNPCQNRKKEKKRNKIIRELTTNSCS